jgi:hypothetical protein
MGKWTRRGCILPLTCSHGGTINLLSNSNKKTSRQFRHKQILNKRLLIFYDLDDYRKGCHTKPAETKIA